MIIGLDMAGEVATLGEGVSGWTEGARVLVNPLNKRKGLLGEGVEHHAARTPVRRVGRPEDIAATCAFLVRDEAGYITGQVIGVNGGRNT